MTFKLNDKVAWTSQAQGMARRKVGIVVQVVAPHNSPKGLKNPGYPRIQESYVVSVPGKTARAKPKLHWPVASLLKRARDNDVCGSMLA